MSVLAPLVGKHGHRRVGVSLLQMPQLAGWKQHLPSPFDETVAVMHLKVYAFDDTLLLSGANLSSDYFEQRQDRYVEVRRAPALAEHYHGLIARLSQCDRAFQLKRRQGSDDAARGNGGGSADSNGGESFATQLLAPAPDGSRMGFEAALARFFAPEASAPAESVIGSGDAGTPDASFVDTTLVPTLQFGQGRFDGATCDADLVHALLEGCAHGVPGDTASRTPGVAGGAGEIRLASGYFNLLPSVQRVVARSRADVSVVTASPQANGFFGAAGIKGALPQAYVELETDFLHTCARERAGQTGANDGVPAEEGSTTTNSASTDADSEADDAASQGDALGHVRVYEYVRPGWTFHAKGLWLRVGDALLSELLPSRAPQTSRASSAASASTPGGGSDKGQQRATAPDTPNATLVGSSNFGARSAQRDLESQVFLCTDNEALRQRLLEEWAALSQSTEDAESAPAAGGGAGDSAVAAVAELVDSDVMARPERQLQGWGWSHGHWIKPVTNMIRTFM